MRIMRKFIAYNVKRLEAPAIQATQVQIVSWR